MNEKQEDQTIMAQAEAAIAAQQAQAGSLNNQTFTQSQMLEQQDKGLAEEQLDLAEDLERLEHLLRGEIIKRDETTGVTHWDKPTDSRLVLLNEYGVRRAMFILNVYISKIKLLSNYSEEIINQKMEDFATEVADLIFMEYREMGFDTPEKKKMYSMTVRIIQDAVHDIYLRALGGKERDSIRKHWNIQESMGGMGNEANGGGSRLNPMNWLRR